MKNHPEASRGSRYWPDLCSNQSLLILLLLAFSLALVFTLLQPPEPMGFWLNLGQSLMFTAWVTMLSAGALCLLNRHAVLSPGWQGHVTVVLVVQLMVFVSSVVAHAALAAPGSGSGVWISDGWTVGRNQVIALIATLVFLRYIEFRRQWARQLAAESTARLDALQARIRPHFLFNTLNTIASLIHRRPDEAERATLDLADLLRSGLKQADRHSLADELDLIRGYLRIEALRLGERLEVEWELAEDLPLDVQLPPLLLQPLVENAILHGIARREAGGVLRISGQLVRGKRMRFTVANPLADDEAPGNPGTRTALDNIRQRLALAFEEGFGLKTRVADGHFQAELTLPVLRPPPEPSPASRGGA